MVVDGQRGALRMYKIFNAETIQRLEDSVYIPRDDANADYQAFLVWERSGGKILPADPDPVYVPQEVSAAQAYAALIAANLYDDAEAWAANPNTSMLDRLAFQKATTFRRDSPALKAGAAALGWSEATLDQLFLSAHAFKL